MKSTTKTIALAGVMTALIFVLFVLETMFSSMLLTVSSCFLSLPLAITLSVYDIKSKGKMFLGGTIIGCSCLVTAFILGFIDFQNPLVSVLPRVLIGISAYWSAVLVKKLTEKSKNPFVQNVLPYSVAGLCGTITNTLFVTLMLRIFYVNKYVASVFEVFIVLNFPIEIVSSIILVPLYVMALKKAGFGTHSLKGKNNVINN